MGVFSFCVTKKNRGESMAEIKPMLGIHLDLTKPVDEIVNVINAVLENHPFQKVEILQELDLRIGEAIASQERQTSPEEGGGENERSGDRSAIVDKQSAG